MPFDMIAPAAEAPVKIAPTVENFIRVLRDRSLWPTGFKWGYENCRNCAMGLAVEIWGDAACIDAPHPLSMNKIFNRQIPSSIFLFLASALKKRVEPEDVANALETWLKDPSSARRREIQGTRLDYICFDETMPIHWEAMRTQYLLYTNPVLRILVEA